MRTLIVVDMQNDFITGSLGTKEAVDIVPRVKKKIEEYDLLRDRIIFTRDTHYNGYLKTNEGKHLPVPHCMYHTHGWQIADGLLTKRCHVINKETFGTLEFEEGWNLQDAEVVELVGVCTDICVISNALILKALCPEVEIIVDASCCAGTTLEMHKAALAVMKSCQINVINEENA